MSESNDNKTTIGAGEDSGVTDVRLVRAKIAAQYDGDLRRHVTDTDRLVAPLIEKLGLKQGVPPRPDESRSGTEG
jgi:hypothetical protein